MKSHPVKKCFKIRPIGVSFFLLLFLLLFFTINLPLVIAKTLESDQYRLELKRLSPDDPTQTPPSSAPLSPNILRGELVTSSGKSEVSISEDFIQFGSLSPTNPITRSLSFSFLSQPRGFLFYQDLTKPLQNDKGTIIPQTSCDNGSCTISEASLWNSTLTYGVGIRCDNKQESSCPDDFIEKNTFHPLGDHEAGLSLSAASKNSSRAEIELLYKVNIAGSQPQGNYQASITYFLLPRL